MTQRIIKWMPFIALAALFLFIPQTSHAAEMSMPWDAFLQDVADTLTGKTALTLATIGIAICGIGLFLGNGGDGFRKFLIVIIGLCIVVYAATFVNIINNSVKNPRVSYVHTIQDGDYAWKS